MADQLEFLPQPEPEPAPTLDLVAYATQIGAVAARRDHSETDPTDIDVRSALLRDGENLRAEQAPVLRPGALKALSGPGGKTWKATREELDALPPGPKI